MYKKLIASLMVALMAALTLASPTLAATALNTYPTFLGKSGDFYVVVGKDAATIDVVGAVDIASNLAQLSYKEVVTAVAAEEVKGKMKEVGFDSPLNSVANFGSELTWRQLPQLKDTTITFRGEEYRYTEKLAVPNWEVKLKSAPTDAADYYYLDIPGGGGTTPLKYTLTFDKNFTANVSTDYPLEITILGTRFKITDIDAATDKFKALVGKVFTVGLGEKVTVDGYTIEVVTGATNKADFKVTDAAGTVIGRKILSAGDEWSVVPKLKIKLLSATVFEVPEKVLSVEFVAGVETEKVYKSDDTFPGETGWKFTGLSFQRDKSITKGDTINVVYVPDDAVELKIGQKASLPGETLNVEYVGTTATSYVDVSIAPAGSVTVYNADDPEKKVTTGHRLELTSTGTAVFSYPAFGVNEYGKVDLVFNATDKYVLAYYDAISGKWLNLTAVISLNNTDAPAEGKAEITVGLTQGDGKYNLTVYSWNMLTLNPEKTGNVTIAVFPQGDAAQNITYDFRYTDADKFKLGAKKSEAETTDVKVVGVERGTREYDLLTKEGIKVYKPKSNAEADKAKIAIHDAEEFKNKVAIGKVEAAAAPGEKVKEVVPITTTVAKLDSEITATDKATKHLILVGGPCANTLVQALVDAGKIDATYTCAGKVPGAAWTADTGYIMVIDDAFATGKYVVVVAGTMGVDTRLASTVLQQYETKLKDITASTAKITGTAIATATIAAA